MVSTLDVLSDVFKDINITYGNFIHRIKDAIEQSSYEVH